MTRTFVSEH